MATVNHHRREIGLKIVYYGPELGGKTSSLQFVHRALTPDARGQLVSLATGSDRTLYFDFLPLSLSKVKGYHVRVHLYTVPGQVYYNSTRKLVLEGADGVVFVADSQRNRLQDNTESIFNLAKNLSEQNRPLEKLPWIIQYNKRDLPDVMSKVELERELNMARVPSFETIATTGEGIFEALRTIARLVFADFRRQAPFAEMASHSDEANTLDIKPAGTQTHEEAKQSFVASTLSDITKAIEMLSPQRRIPAMPSVAPTAPPSTSPPPVPTPQSTSKSASKPDKAAKTDKPSFAAAHEQILKGYQESRGISPEETIEDLAALAPDLTGDEPPDEITATKLPQAWKRPVIARSMADLIKSTPLGDAIVLVEQCIDSGDWAGAVRQVSEAFRKQASWLSQSLLSGSTGESEAMSALLAGISASRFLRYREIERRVAATSAVTSEDAVFTLFFLTDFALRNDEIERKQDQPLII